MNPQNEELATFVREVVRAAVHDTLLSMGIDAQDPIRMQRMMANLSEVEKAFTNEQFQKDQLHLRKWREAMDATSSLGAKAIITIIVGGLLTALWVGIKTNFRP